MKLTDDVKQRKQKHFKQYRTAKQKLTNKENLVRFLHRGKPMKASSRKPTTPKVRNYCLEKRLLIGICKDDEFCLGHLILTKI